MVKFKIKTSSWVFFMLFKLYKHYKIAQRISYCLTNKNLFRVLISKIKIEKATGPSRVVSRIIKSAGEAGFKKVKDLIKQISEEGLILREQQA